VAQRAIVVLVRLRHPTNLLSFCLGVVVFSLVGSRAAENEYVGVAMKKPGNLKTTSTPWLALLALLAGCGEEAPPYAALPLRDTLQATPEVIAALPLETRREIARRFEESRQKDIEATSATSVASPPDLAIDSIALAIDETRETREQDALVLGEVEMNEDQIVVRLQGIEQTAIIGSALKDSLVWRGAPDAPTAFLEESALRGHAGRMLQQLSPQTENAELIRVTNLPLGAWAKDEKLYVNASWLVAMAALDDGTAMNNPGGQFVVYGEPPGKSPLTVDFNPYNLPDSLLQCWEQVETTCQCATTCAHQVTDPTFANAVEECAWVNANSANPAILCVLALLSSEDIRLCVASGRSCPVNRVDSREDAVRFLANDACVSFLDACLQDGYIPTPSNSSGGSGSTSSGCGGCDNDCGGFGDTCSQCNEDCAECNQNWEDCNQNCKDCNQNYEDSKNCSKCSVKSPTLRQSNSGPSSSAFWLTAPMVYVLYRGRRRAAVKRS
jgi:hypothetical protein